MNKLEKLEEQYKKLGEEIQALKKNEEFVPGWYMYWDSEMKERRVNWVKNKTVLSNTKVAWDHVEPVTQELLNQFIPKPKTKYDWSKFPDWATIAVMNSDGSICCADYKSVKLFTSGWRGVGDFVYGWSRSDEYVSYIDESQWKDSFEKRPNSL